MKTLKPILIYDLKSLPDVNNSDEPMTDIITKLFEERNVVFWDSHNEGVEPKVVNMNDLEVVFTDVSTQENDDLLGIPKEKLK